MALVTLQVQKECPKCGCKKMTYATRQTRSADEGQTVFYTCPKCRYVANELPQNLLKIVTFLPTTINIQLILNNYKLTWTINPQECRGVIYKNR